jgi:hypothetical protein
MSPTVETHDSPHDPSGTRTTPGFLIALAWLFVGIPGAWGVSQTVSKSMVLFNAPPPAPATAPAVAPAK